MPKYSSVSELIKSGALELFPDPASRAKYIRENVENADTLTPEEFKELWADIQPLLPESNLKEATGLRTQLSDFLTNDEYTRARTEGTPGINTRADARKSSESLIDALNTERERKAANWTFEEGGKAKTQPTQAPPTQIGRPAASTIAGLMHLPSIAANGFLGAPFGIMNAGMAVANPPSTPGEWVTEAMNAAIGATPFGVAKGVNQGREALKGFGKAIASGSLPLLAGQAVDNDFDNTNRTQTAVLSGLTGGFLDAGGRASGLVVSKLPAYIIPKIMERLEKMQPNLSPTEMAESAKTIFNDLVIKAGGAEKLAAQLKLNESQAEIAGKGVNRWAGKVGKLQQEDEKLWQQKLDLDTEFSKATKEHTDLLNSQQRLVFDLEQDLAQTKKSLLDRGVPENSMEFRDIMFKKQQQIANESQMLKSMESNSPQKAPEQVYAKIARDREQVKAKLNSARSFLDSFTGKRDELVNERDQMTKALDAIDTIGGLTGRDLASDPHTSRVLKKAFSSKESGEAVINHIVNKMNDPKRKDEALPLIEAIDKIYGADSKHKQVIQKRFLDTILSQPNNPNSMEAPPFQQLLDNFGEEAINRLFGSENAYKNFSRLSKGIAEATPDSPIAVNLRPSGIGAGVGATLFLLNRFATGQMSTGGLLGGLGAMAATGAIGAAAPMVFQWKGILNGFIRAHPDITETFIKLTQNPRTTTVSTEAYAKFVQHMRQTMEEEQKRQQEDAEKLKKEKEKQKSLVLKNTIEEARKVMVG